MPELLDFFLLKNLTVRVKCKFMVNERGEVLRQTKKTGEHSSNKQELTTKF